MYIFYIIHPFDVTYSYSILIKIKLIKTIGLIIMINYTLIRFSSNICFLLNSNAIFITSTQHFDLNNKSQHIPNTRSKKKISTIVTDTAPTEQKYRTKKFKNI